MFYDNRQQQRSDSSSDQDCQPQVEERCSAVEVRLAATRKCVSTEQYDCTPFCGPLEGELIAELGMCRCAQYISAEELCDQFCLMKAPKISMSIGSNGQFLLQIEDSERRRSRKLEVLNVLGPDHIRNSERVQLVVFASSGIFGVIVSSAQVVEAFLTGDTWSVPTPRKSKEREQIVTSVHSGSLPRIPNPILCFNEGDLVLFQLSILPNERASSHYPIYQKDHLFNSNPHWDFGAFRRLDYLIRETNVNISRFAHVFTTPGAYVFQDNGIRERSLFITVKSRNVHCDPAASHIQPSSPYQLTKNGFLPRQKLNLAPNWGAIVGVLLLLFIVMIVLLIITLLLRPSLYKASPMKNWKPRWRSLGEPYIPPEYVLTQDSLQFYETVGCHGSGEVFDIGKKEITYGLDERDTIRVLEDFSVRTLFDKLEDQTLHLTSQLGRHRNETLSFYKAFIQRIQLLKDMIQNLELSSSKNFEWRKVPLDGELESVRTNITSQQSEGSARTMTREFHTDHIQGEFLQEAIALMKALKLALMKTSTELTVKKTGTEKKQQHKGMIDTSEHSADRHQDQNQTKKNLYEGIINGNLSMLSMEGLHLQPLQFMRALYREDNLRRLISASPLTKTLEEIKEALKAQAQEKEMTKMANLATTGDLVPMNISQLSPRQMVIYQFGSAILHFACDSSSQSSLLLLIAQDIPRVQSSVWGREALRLGESYYDTENNILFVPKTSLEHAGELAVCIIHAVAQIKAGQQPLPVNCDYLHCMNRAVMEICQTFFRCWGTQSATLMDKHERDPEVRSLVQDLLFIHKPPDHYHLSKRCDLHNGMKLWKEFGSTLSKNTDRERGKHREDDSDRTVLQEETLDGLNEEFLQLVTQALQNKKEKKELADDLQSAKDPSVLHRLSEKTRMGVMLEIKRRCTEEKIRSAESGLLYLQEPNITSSSPSPGSCEDPEPAHPEI